MIAFTLSTALRISSVVEPARTYKPNRRLFDYAHEQPGVSRDIGFRCVWIDRGTGRKCLPDYTPDATPPTLDRVPPLSTSPGW